MTRFFDHNSEVSMPILFSTKQGENESVLSLKGFTAWLSDALEGWTSKHWLRPTVITSKHPILTQIGFTECESWKQLKLLGKYAEKLIAHNRANANSNKPRTDKPPKQQSFQTEKKESQASATTSSSSQQPNQATSSSSHGRGPPKGPKNPSDHPPHVYSFKDENADSLFKMLMKGDGLNCHNPADLKRLERLMTPNTMHITISSATLPKISTSSRPNTDFGRCSGH